MIAVRLTLAVLVAEDTFEDVVVARRHVAGGAGELMASRRDRERALVIERRRRPAVGAVAVGTAGAEAGARVIGIARSVVVALVAGEAVGRRPGVTVAVTGGAGERAMRAGQLEAGRVVVERGRLPGGDAVTALAGGREARVARVRRPAVVALVARQAVGRRAGVAVAMTGGAGHRAMRAVQLEAGRVVVERGRLPGGRAVTVLAGGREARVVGIARRGVVALMAGETVGGGAGVAVAMAGGAGDRTMRAAQLETGGVVIEGRRLPGGRAVAALAGGRKTGMARVARAVVVGLMAGETVRWRAGVSARVARGAWGRAMRAGELETGRVVVEGRRLPGGDAVTVLAGRREAAVTRVAGAVVARLVAREAIARRAGVGRAVAVDAAGGTVRSAEREAGVVVVEERRLPGGETMTVATGGGKAGVHRIPRRGEVVLMAGKALARCAGVAGAVAERALDGAVSADELEAGLIVIEGRRLPRGHAMTVLAAVGEAGVHGIARAGEVPLVAGETVARRRGVTVAVAGDAVDRAVGAVQLERRSVVVESGRLPGGDAVAGLAGGREAGVARACGAGEGRFVAGVAVGLALLEREVERRMAALAGEAGMPAGEIEAGLRVPIGQRRAQRRPALGGMAFGAFALQGAVRIRRSLLTGERRHGQEREQSEPGCGGGEEPRKCSRYGRRLDS